jgi:hypothetical protein
MFGVTLPVSVARESGAGLQIVDYRARSVSATADATGTITAAFPTVDDGYLWLVERITVLCTSATPTQAVAYAGEPIAQNMVDGTSRGNLDTADQSSPVLIDSSIALTIQWTGASAGAIGVARIQYQLVQRTI